MNDEEVSELRSYFKNSANLAKEEEVHSLMQQRVISSNDAINEIGKLRIDSFNNGIKQYQLEHGVWPMKVPVYVRNALVGED